MSNFVQIIVILSFIAQVSPSSGHANISRASLVFTSETETVLTTFTDEEIPAKRIITDCQAVITEFADQAAIFTKCSLTHARPLRFCENCFHSYREASELYHALRENIDDCGQYDINGDEVELIVQTGDFLDKVWRDANCDHCFDHTREKNGSIIWQQNNYTNEFFQLLNETWTCFFLHTPGSVMPFPPAKYNVTNSTACKYCSHQYDALSSYYIWLQHKFHYHSCMDIADAMNHTRQFWSSTLHCLPRVNHYLVLAATVGVLTVIIIFYLMNFMLSGSSNSSSDNSDFNEESELNHDFYSQTSLPSTPDSEASSLVHHRPTPQVFGDL